MQYELKQELKFLGHSDVVIIGGGPGGISAAVTAARNGASVTLVEKEGQLGGMAYIGEVQPFMPNHINHKTLDGPFYIEWIKTMRKYLPQDELPPVTENLSEWIDIRLDKFAAMFAAEDLCLEAGVRLLFHHTFFDVIKEDRKIKAVVLHSKSGLSYLTAETFIDSSGDGDLAAKAGCDFEFGDGEGDCQPMTLCFKMNGLCPEKNIPPADISKLWVAAKEAGEVVDAPNDSIGWFLSLYDDVAHFNQTRVGGLNPLDGEDLSKAEIEARRQVRQLIRFLNAKAPGFEKAKLLSMANHIGARESRRVVGRQWLTLEDYDALRKYPDAIARIHYPVDVHNSKTAGFIYRPLPECDWYEVPYGCIVAKDMDNLLISSRCLSSDHMVNSSLRVMPIMTAIGQAAGMAAAMAKESQCMISELDGVNVRKRLIDYGAKLGDLEVIPMKRENWDQP